MDILQDLLEAHGYSIGSLSQEADRHFQVNTDIFLARFKTQLTEGLARLIKKLESQGSCIRTQVSSSSSTTAASPTPAVPSTTQPTHAPTASTEKSTRNSSPPQNPTQADAQMENNTEKVSIPPPPSSIQLFPTNVLFSRCESKELLQRKAQTDNRG